MNFPNCGLARIRATLSDPAIRLALSLALAFGFIACEDKGAAPQADSRLMDFQTGFKVGDKRILLREYRNQGRIYGMDLFSLGEIEIEKDTSFDGLAAKIFKLEISEFLPETTYVSGGRGMLLAHGDSLNVYYFNGFNGGFTFDLLKRSAYDTVYFWDKMTQWINPLPISKKWLIRPEGEKHLALEKEWVGKETLGFDGKDYECDVFILHSFVPVKSWIGPMGMLKAEIVFGPPNGPPNIWTDSLGQGIDTSTVDWERYELLKLNPSPAEIAAAKTKYRPMSTQHLPPRNPDP